MYSVLLALHVLFCLFVVMVVLLQSGKGAGFGGLMGGGGSDAIFNAPSGSMFMRKLTTAIAVGFFLTSLLLTYMGARNGAGTVTRAFPATAPIQTAAPETETPATTPVAAPTSGAPAKK
jgi:preprotein translocase subunit SecG